MRDLLLRVGFLLVACGGLVGGWAIASGQFRRESADEIADEIVDAEETS